MKVRTAVFPVAGLGTRFLPVSKTIPKEMLPLVNKPIIQYSVEEAIDSGIEKIIFVTSRGKEAIENYFEPSLELETILKKRGKDKLLKEIQSFVFDSGTIVYTRQNEPLGLGHAVWCARKAIGNEPFAVLLPDDVFQANPPVLKQMIEKFEELNASIFAVSEVNPNSTDRYGILDTEETIKDIMLARGLIEKPKPEKSPTNLAIIGRYIFTPSILENLEQIKFGAGGEMQLTDAMQLLLKNEKIYGFRYKGIRYDCGDTLGYQLASLAFSINKPEIKSELISFFKSLIA